MLSPCRRTNMEGLDLLRLDHKSLVICFYIVTILTSNLLVPVYSVSFTELRPNDRIHMRDVEGVQRFDGGSDEGGINHFKVLSMDGHSMMVGARNTVHNISLASLVEDMNRKLTWKPAAEYVKNCEQTLSYVDQTHKPKCENYIRVFGKTQDGNYYVCGTNAISPICQLYEYNADAFPKPKYTPINEELGEGKCPYDPEHNSTAIFADGRLYSATVADFFAKDPLIFRDMKNSTKSPSLRVRTLQYDSIHLSDPHFVNSFEIDDKIFFFFRENAIEHMNCGKVKFSRVARVCKNDQGTGQGLVKNWSSFFKARLNCSFPGKYPFSFDEIEATSDFSQGNYMSTEASKNRTRMFYGIFNTPENSIQGSAVCAFSYNDIVKVFEGKFKVQESKAHNWLAVDAPDPHPTICSNDSDSLPSSRVNFIQKTPLMNDAVPSAGGAPLLMSSTSRFTAIAVDWQVYAADNRFYDVMFIGTDDGRVVKSINKGRGAAIENVVIEDIQVMGKHEVIKELKVYKEGRDERLIAISRENIVSIPLHRCHNHNRCGDCVALQDPYCAWSGGLCAATSRGIQDVHHGNGGKVCPDGGARDETKLSSTTTAPTTEMPLSEKCPECKCDCHKGIPSASSALVNVTPPTDNGEAPIEDDTGIPSRPSVDESKPCAPKLQASRSDDQVYTAATLAIASVISIVVSVLVGFVIGYRVSMCRAHTRNTDQVINDEQTFGSLRKNRNHSIGSSHNYYSEPNVKIKNLLANNIPSKSPNLPNGSIDSKAVTPKQVSKTYL